MSNTLRTAALGAALLAGTTAAGAQTVIVPDADYVAPPVAVAPAPTVIVPAAPGVVVEPAPVVVEPAPLVDEEIVTPAAPAATETIVQPPPPARRIIRHHARTTQVRLTTRQRREVLHTIRYERPAPTVTERVSYPVGTVLPASVPVYAMPERVIYEAPELRGYDYTLVGDRMLVVEPDSNTVVDEIY